jgi:hypothetical protein
MDNDLGYYEKVNVSEPLMIDRGNWTSVGFDMHLAAMRIGINTLEYFWKKSVLSQAPLNETHTFPGLINYLQDTFPNFIGDIGWVLSQGYPPAGGRPGKVETEELFYAEILALKEYPTAIDFAKTIMAVKPEHREWGDSTTTFHITHEPDSKDVYDLSYWLTYVKPDLNNPHLITDLINAQLKNVGRLKWDMYGHPMLLYGLIPRKIKNEKT